MEGLLCLETLEEMGLGLARGMRLTASCAFEGTMGVARHCTRGPVHLLAPLCAFHLPPPVPVVFLSFLYLIPLFFVLLLFYHGGLMKEKLACLGGSATGYHLCLRDLCGEPRLGGWRLPVPRRAPALVDGTRPSTALVIHVVLMLSPLLLPQQPLLRKCC